MTLEDVEAVYRLSCDCFSVPWSLESITKEMSNPVAYYSVAEEAGHIIGYGGLWSVLDEGEITNIAVNKSYRGQGIGKAILGSLMAEASGKSLYSVTLEVRESNIAAQRLYMNQGFEEIARRKAYYKSPNEDAIIMQALLNQ